MKAVQDNNVHKSLTQAELLSNPVVQTASNI